MNSEEFKRTGGIDASPTAMRKAFHGKFPYQLTEAIIALSKNCRKNPGGESGAQAILDSYLHFGPDSVQYYGGDGEWSIKLIVRSMLDHDVKRWHGIKAAKAKKVLRNWSGW